MTTKIILPKYKRWGAKWKNHELITQILFQDASLVKSDSPMKDKKCVYKMACFFRREFNYDMVQFCEYDKDNYEAYLFQDYNNPDEVYGACCFRERNYKDSGKMWALQWIWFHPYFRSKGNLKRHWPFFLERYGNFHVEGPLSVNMFEFCKKYHGMEMNK